MALVVGVLGSITLVVDGTERPLASAAQRRLLAMLSIEEGAVVSIDRLAHELRVSNGAVRTAISRLRGTAGASHIVREPPGYRLVGAELDVDLVHRLLGASDAAEPRDRLELLQRAHSCWRGRSLAEFESEEWAIAAAQGFSELRAEVDEERIDALLVTGHVADALGALATHIRQHPFRERPRCSLMTALALHGRSVEALRASRRFRAMLRDEAGSVPSQHFQELELAILDGRLGDNDSIGPDGLASPSK